MGDTLDQRRASSAYIGVIVIPDDALAQTCDEVEMSKRQIKLGIATFTFAGVGCLLFWNLCLCTINNVANTMYQNGSLADTMVAVYQTFNISVQLLFIFCGGVRRTLFVSAMACTGVLVFMVPVILQVASAKVAVPLLYVLMVPVGTCMGILFGCGFTFAAIMPVNFCGYVAFGMGVSGLISFGLWMLVSKVIFDSSTPQGLLYGIWLLFCCVGFMYFGIAALMYFTLNLPWASNAIWRVHHPLSVLRVTREHPPGSSSALYKESNKGGNANKGDTEKQNMSSEKSEENCVVTIKDSVEPVLDWWTLIKVIFPQLFNMGITLWITLNVFPVVGPYSWQGPSMGELDVIMGMFQIGDFIGRYLPNGNIPYVGKLFMIKPKWLLLPVLIRLCFIPLFVLSFKLQSTAVINDLWYQLLLMLVFGMTDGWFVVLGSIYNPEQVKHEKNKGRAGLLGSVVMMLGIVTGLWTSKLWKIGS
eukprot:GHVQ01023953.1.p1 GENE.GHVQ01023953.1~~GHVQ01023953.1.p1  ORF type:complete len:474 (-),score=34.99 GHVQ01023953.1:3170-4591(-)